jgi:glycosyltransferase involved in cell wall biosynthesis
MYKNEKVNIIMPVYNEENTLEEIINRVLAQKMVDKLVIVDDYSKDKSRKIIEKAAKNDKRISFLYNSENKGKGYSVRRGLSEIKSGIIIIQDADLEYYPEDYAKLLPKLNDNTIVLGTRMLGKNTGHKYVMAKIANAALTSTFNLLYGMKLTDINTCYKVFKVNMLKGVNLTEDGFLIEPQILIGLIKKGYNIAEVNIRYKGRTYKEGKKITAKDGIEQGLFMISSKLKD